MKSKNFFAALAADSDSEWESIGSQSPPQSASPVMAPQTLTPSTPLAMPPLSQTTPSSFDWADNVEEELAADQEYRRRQSEAAGAQQEQDELESVQDHVTDRESDEQGKVKEARHETSEAPEVADEQTASHSLHVIVVEEAIEDGEDTQAEFLSPLHTIEEEAEGTAEPQDPQFISVILAKQTTVSADDSAQESLTPKAAAPVSKGLYNIHNDTKGPRVIEKFPGGTTHVIEEQQQTSSSSSSGEEHDTGATSPEAASPTPSVTGATARDGDILAHIRAMDKIFGVSEEGNWNLEVGHCVFFDREDFTRIHQHQAVKEAEERLEKDDKASEASQEAVATSIIEKKEEDVKSDDRAKKGPQREFAEKLETNLDEHSQSRNSSLDRLAEKATSLPVAQAPLSPVQEATVTGEDETIFRAPLSYATPPMSYAKAAKALDTLAATPKAVKQGVGAPRVVLAAPIQGQKAAQQEVKTSSSTAASKTRHVNYRTKIAVPTVNFTSKTSSSTSTTAARSVGQGQKASVLDITISALTEVSMSSTPNTEYETSDSARPHRVARPATRNDDGWVIPSSRQVARPNTTRPLEKSFPAIISSGNDYKEDFVAPMPGEDAILSTKSGIKVENNTNGPARVDDVVDDIVAVINEAPRRRKNRRSRAQRNAARRATQAAQAAAIDARANQVDVAHRLVKQEYLEKVPPDHLQYLPRRKHGYFGAIAVMATGSALMVGASGIVVAVIKSI